MNGRGEGGGNEWMGKRRGGRRRMDMGREEGEGLLKGYDRIQ